MEVSVEQLFSQDTCDLCGNKFLDLYAWSGTLGNVLLCKEHFIEMEEYEG